MADKLTLCRGFQPGWLGDEVSFEFTGDGFRVVHHESDAGQLMPWSHEFPYRVVHDVEVRTETPARSAWVRQGITKARLATHTAPHAGTGTLVISLRLDSITRRLKELVVAGAMRNLEELAQDLSAKCRVQHAYRNWRD
jgi:hypothetical protein